MAFVINFNFVNFRVDRLKVRLLSFGRKFIKFSQRVRIKVGTIAARPVILCTELCTGLTQRKINLRHKLFLFSNSLIYSRNKFALG